MRLRALDETLGAHGYQPLAVFARERATQLILVRRAHARHVGYDLHYLLLPYDNAVVWVAWWRRGRGELPI